MKNTESIRFGFFPYEWEVAFSIGKIIPVPEFKKTANGLRKCIHEDGHIYPPISRRLTTTATGKTRTIPKTKRPAFHFCLPVSHEMVVTPKRPESDLRLGSAGFILLLLEYLFKIRLQFEGWTIDGRISTRPPNNGVSCGPRYAGHCLSEGYSAWISWPEKAKERFLNILFMSSRASIYEWDWERFITEYMVLDACWRMGKDLFNFKEKKHGSRAQELCDHFKENTSQFGFDLKDVIELRNDLFHEAFWHSGRPSHTFGKLGYCAAGKLGMLNRQLIGDFLGLPKNLVGL